MRQNGFFIRLHTHLSTSRIGDLLIRHGIIDRHDLEKALAWQKEQDRRMPIGRVLVQQGALTRRALYGILAEQWTLRGLAFVTGFLITTSAFNPRPASAESGFVLAAASFDIDPIKSYPKLFNYAEKRSGDLSAFKKWSNVLSRFNNSIGSMGNDPTIAEWKKQLTPLAGMPLEDMARRVNSLMNSKPYIEDKKLWGKSDYWATPAEFLKKGGDCEDYAIAKFLSLKALGVPEERMRVAIVHDRKLNIPHALLIVYGDGETYVLDNQNSQMLSQSDVRRYKPIYSINNRGWWLHSEDKGGQTVLASAR